MTHVPVGEQAVSLTDMVGCIKAWRGVHRPEGLVCRVEVAGRVPIFEWRGVVEDIIVAGPCRGVLEMSLPDKRGGFGASEVQKRNPTCLRGDTRVKVLGRNKPRRWKTGSRRGSTNGHGAHRADPRDGRAHIETQRHHG